MPDRPDEISGYDPDMTTVIEVLKAFNADASTTPEKQGWHWFDITEDFDDIS